MSEPVVSSFVNDRALRRHLNHPRLAERTTQEIFDPLPRAFDVARFDPHALIDAEFITVSVLTHAPVNIHSTRLKGQKASITGDFIAALRAMLRACRYFELTLDFFDRFAFSVQEVFYENSPTTDRGEFARRCFERTESHRHVKRRERTPNTQREPGDWSGLGLYHG